MSTTHQTKIKTASPPPSHLNAATLKVWRDRMGYSHRDACAALGCSRGAWGGWERGTAPVPLYIGLAMAALATGMKPYAESADPANPTGE